MLVRVEPTRVQNFGLSMTTTRPRRYFKAKAGHNNHLLITALVGLDCILDENIDISPDFSTSWTPKSRKNSYLRSRQFVLETTLVWISDQLDGYFSSILKMPGLLDSRAVERISGEESRAKRLMALARDLSVIGSEAALLVEAAFIWRNRVVHGSGRRKQFPGELRSRLRDSAEVIRADYCGLDVDRYIEHVEGEFPPTFKEVASTISAAQKFVEQLDRAAISSLNLERFAEHQIASHLQSRVEQGFSSVFVQFWPGDSSKTARRLRQLLLQSGFRPAISGDRELDEEWAAEVSGLSPRQAKERFGGS